MPVKNAARFLKECLDSIIEQTYLDWELIAINDHSSDGSLALLTDYAKKDPRIAVHTNTGNGIIDALRLAFSLSKGHLITRMDADDRMPSQKLETMTQLLQKQGEGHLAIGGVRYFSEAGLGDGYRRYAQWLNRLTSSSTNFTEIYQECVVPSPCWMVYREDLLRCGSFESNRYPEDYDLCFRFYEFGLEVIGTSAILHEWRDYPTRTSRTDDNYADNRFLELKLDYFCKLEIQTGRPIVLWGAGKKGKTIARYLVDKGLQFSWLCNNDRKIGHQISGVTLMDTSHLYQFKNPIIIIAVANPTDKQEIERLLLHQNKIGGKDYYFFA